MNNKQIILLTPNEFLLLFLQNKKLYLWLEFCLNKIWKKCKEPYLYASLFTTQLWPHQLEVGTDVRYILEFMGHKSSRTTELYTHVSMKSLNNIT
jgi:integrase